MNENWAAVRAMCSTCQGTGVYHGSPGEQVPCPECNGDGYNDTKMQVKIKTITDKLDEILEKLNT